ncbi:NAD(P)/FAD-dependent oxidoreductase [Streptomyces sp. NPDC018693]|uniref:NAD(P)/FAD-dependent oxidoreductase n=1 Tax=unclassified Streptomyces TaxID=2593676 RepID=UPI0037A0F408
MGVMGEHAVVIGASMGGLVAAKTLSRRFRRVTVFERDVLPQKAENRRSVPHGAHAHALLISGRLALEKLFPGLTDELVEGGAVLFDPGHDLLFHQMGALRVRFASGRLGVSLSRAYLERAVRGRVEALDNVTVRDRTPVRELVLDRGRVTGVALDGDERIPTDLVVDATGRGGGGPSRTLRRFGYPEPGVDTVKIDVGYTTRLLHRSPGDLKDGALLYLMSAVPPHDKRAAAAFAIEGDRWMVTLGGWHRAHAPVDPAGFTDFATSLEAPEMAGLLARAKPLDDDNARKFTYPGARRRYYERLRRLPAGHVALGDAICSFNPLYGQGMTVAALEAIALGECLDRFKGPSAPMARAYYRAAGRIIDTPWQMATGGDFVYPETVGPRPPGTGLVNRYVRQVMLASHVSVHAHRIMLEVQHLLTAPSAVMRPATVVRALFAARRSPARDASARPEPRFRGGRGARSGPERYTVPG